MALTLMKGSEAIAEAAIRAGARYFFGYPITPQTEIPEYMSARMPEVDGCFLQAESEVAAINMVYGAAGTGARVITSSSSPGVSLKQEGISYCAGAMVPAVIINVMRGGPVLLCIRRTVQQDLPVSGKRRSGLRQRQREDRARVGHKICCVRRFDSVAAGRTGKPGIRTGSRAGAKRGNQKERKEQRQDLSDISHRFPSCFSLI